MTANFIVEPVELTNMIFTEEYKVFQKDLFQLDMFLEELNDPTVTKERNKHGAVRNTFDTTKDVFGAVGDITYVGGSAIKAFIDLGMKLLQFMIKIITWFCNNIKKLPIMIGRGLDSIANIPSAIKAKVRGDIQLNITIDSISAIYNNSFFNYIDEFITKAQTLAKGDSWGVMFGRRKMSGEKIDDIKLCNQMNTIYIKLSGVSFTKTTIPMNPENFDKYFTRNDSVKFSDYHGNSHTCSYIDALKTIAEDLANYVEPLNVIRGTLGEKFDRTAANDMLSKLNSRDRNIITSAITQVSSVISVIGNLTKYIIEDSKIIDECGAVILKKMRNRK